MCDERTVTKTRKQWLTFNNTDIKRKSIGQAFKFGINFLV